MSRPPSAPQLRTSPARSWRRAGLVGAAGAVVVLGLSVGVPSLLWWAAGGRVMPDPGPGGWAEAWAQVRVGLVPGQAAVATAILVGWLLWLYLATLLLLELRIAWRNRKLGRGDRRELTGPRWLMARIAGWLLAGHTMAASLLLAPPHPLVSSAGAQVVATALANPIEALAPHQPAASPGFDRDAYLAFGASSPAVIAAQPATIERTILWGDTLWGIAADTTGNGLNYRAIWAATDLTGQHPPLNPRNPNLIHPGNVVRIPTSLIPDARLRDLLPPADPSSSPAAPTAPAVAAPALPATNDDDAPASSATMAPDVIAPAVPAPALGVPSPASTSVPDAPGIRPSSPAAPQQPSPAGASSVPVLAVGLGGGASVVVLAGLGRRRRRAMAASRRGERPAPTSRRSARTRQRLQSGAGQTLWSPDDLVASWNSLQPLDPGARQPWCVRWNSTLRTLECAWTTDSGLESNAGPDQPPEPGPTSPWTLITKRDRAGHPVPVWTLHEDDVPGAPGRLVVPAMVSCAGGRSDQPARDGFFINLEAAGIIAVESTRPDQIEPEGVIRSLLVQLNANDAAQIHVLNTDLGVEGLGNHIHRDSIALEAQLVEQLTTNANQPWDEAPSVFALRSSGRYSGPTTVVVGRAEELQTCSHLLSLARAANVPLAVLALGPLSNARATLILEPEPDKHTIRFPAARAVLSFDHLSWLSAADATALVDLVADTSQPWQDRDDRDPVEDDHDAWPLDDDLPWADDAFADVPLSPDEEHHGGHSSPVPIGLLDLPTRRVATTAPSSTGARFGSEEGGWPEPDDDDPGGQDVEILELWDSLPVADPSSLSDTPAGPAEQLDIDWAIAGDDEAVDGMLKASLDDLVQPPPDLPADDPTPDDWVGWEELEADEPDPDNDGVLVDVGAGTATADASSSGPPLDLVVSRRGDLVPAAASAVPRQATLRLSDDDPVSSLTGSSFVDDQRPEPVAVLNAVSRRPVGRSGLRLEVCGPIRLLQASDVDGDLVEVSTSGGRGLTAGRLALLSYLAVAARTADGGVGREQVESEFWSEVLPDGTFRSVRSDAVKRRVWEVRKALTELASGPTDGLLEASDGRYGLSGVACDWYELIEAIAVAERHPAGADDWACAVETMTALLRPPGLLTPPGAARARSQFDWIDHYQAQADDLTRRAVAILADQAALLTEAGHHRAALDVLATARALTPALTREVADGMVAVHLALGDPAQAERECLVYELQFDEEFLVRERANPRPGNPRARLDAYLHPRRSGS